MTDKNKTLPPAHLAQTLSAHPVRKAFHLNDILSLVTGLCLAKEGAAAVHRLTAFIMESDATETNTTFNAHSAKQCVEEQLPFLADLNLSSLYAIYNYKTAQENPYLNVWREMQALRFGAEHYLVPLSKWTRAKNSHKLPPLPANLSQAPQQPSLPQPQDTHGQEQQG